MNRKVFADLSNAQLVTNANAASLFYIDQPARPGHQDKLRFSVQPMRVNPEESGSEGAAYELLDGAGYTVTILIVKASDGSTLSGPMSSWSVDGQAKAGYIDLNTAAINTALSSATELACIAEFKFDNGSDDITTIRIPFTIQKSYITAGTPSELPLARYPTWEEALAVFVRFYGNPDGSTVTFPNGSHAAVFGCNADGTAKTDAS